MALRRVETELNVPGVESFWAFHKLCILYNVRVLCAVATDDKKVRVCVQAHACVCVQGGTTEICWRKAIHQKLGYANRKFPRDPAILPLDIYPRELKMYVHTKTCT